MQTELQKITQAAGGIPLGPIIAGLVVLALIVVGVAILKRLRAGKTPKTEPPPDLAINVSSLPARRPPVGATNLYCLHVPVRLAVLVLAPAGRIRELPPPDQLSGVLESILPGLARVVSTHSPLVRYWPGQVSVRGFAHTFFTHVKLPGDGGKGTPWCSVAGVFKVDGQPMMAGLLLNAETPANIGQLVVEQEGRWLDFLRIK